MKKLRHILKTWAKKLPFPLSKNHRYDLLTRKIIRRYCSTESNCLDIGAHDGEIFCLFLKYAPAGQHFAFEPLPQLFARLQQQFGNKPNCHLYNLALADHTGTTRFNHVVSNPAYSGIRKRRYDRPREQDEEITVNMDRLDNLLPPDLPVRLIKIDVEGGEMDVLRGSTRTLKAQGPLVIFECGLGGSDVYGTTPEAVSDFFNGLGYVIFLLDDFLRKRDPLDRQAFAGQFYGRRNYYFLAAPASFPRI